MSEAFTVRPLSPIRRMIAMRTEEAKRTIPHYRLGADIETDAVDIARRGLFTKEMRPSLTDFVTKACAEALMEMPALNIQWADGAIRQLESADIAVMVALEEGVATPIVRAAERKSLREISREFKELRERARCNALKTGEILGGSLSISNLGMYGVAEFDAIINAPQCSILALGASRACVLPGAGGGIRTASIMRLTLSCDHRTIDGAVGARFLSAVKVRLESPERLHCWASG